MGNLVNYIRAVKGAEDGLYVVAKSHAPSSSVKKWSPTHMCVRACIHVELYVVSAAFQTLEPLPGEKDSLE